MTPSESTVKEVTCQWSHRRTLSTDSKVRTSLQDWEWNDYAPSTRIRFCLKKIFFFSIFKKICVHTLRFSNFLPVHTKRQCRRLKKVRFLMDTCAFFSTRHRNVIFLKILRFNSSTLTSTTKRCFQKSPLCGIACNEDVIQPQLVTSDSTNYRKCVSYFLSSWLANWQWLF